MEKIGRNAPCLCGSGKKHKHCCLAQDAARQRRLREERDAKIRAVDWLMERYGDMVDEALAERFFQDPEGDMRERMADLSKNAQLAVLICLHEWLIADAELRLNTTRVRASELLLGPGGPLLTAGGRRHLEELAASTLSLYEVLEVHKGKGLLLRDLLQGDEARVFVHEVKAAEALVPWDTLGARILRGEDKCTIGGGLYPLERRHALELADFLVKTIRRESRKKRPSAAAEEIVAFSIIGAWLDALTAPPSLPMLMDAQTKEPILFTTDRYRVSDWPALEDILNARDDVEREDNVWIWAETISEEQFRSLARLERLASGMLEVECRTKGRADAAGKWLKDLAAPYLFHIKRTIKDPREKLSSTCRSLPKSAEKPANEIPPEIRQEILTNYLAEHYDRWPTMRLPALNGKTPLQAAGLKTYRPKLVELLKEIERGEAKRARDSKYPAFDIGFLWERFGLERR